MTSLFLQNYYQLVCEIGCDVYFVLFCSCAFCKKVVPIITMLCYYYYNWSTTTASLLPQLECLLVVVVCSAGTVLCDWWQEVCTDCHPAVSTYCSRQPGNYSRWLYYNNSDYCYHYNWVVTTDTHYAIKDHWIFICRFISGNKSLWWPTKSFICMLGTLA